MLCLFGVKIDRRTSESWTVEEGKGGQILVEYDRERAGILSEIRCTSFPAMTTLTPAALVEDRLKVLVRSLGSRLKLRPLIQIRDRSECF